MRIQIKHCHCHCHCTHRHAHLGNETEGVIMSNTDIIVLIPNGRGNKKVRPV